MAQPIWDPTSQSYLAQEKTNPKDRIDVEVGDAEDSSTFHPQIKIKRWDNEVNASLRLVHAHIPGNITWSDDGEKITWQKRQGQNIWKAIFYHRDDLDEGGYEFEIHLPAKPPQNYLEFTVNIKELDWFYQPALTQEEIDEGAERPENVVGSYAVYHKNKGGINDSAGMEYKVGKAFHVFRPHVVDAQGNETWGTLELDEVNGILRISVDQTWLDNAVYPIVVDPTFGYETIGATSSPICSEEFGSTISNRVGSAYSSTETGTLSTLTARLFAGVEADTFDAKVFVNTKDSGGSGTHAQVATTEVTGIAKTEAWRDFSLSGSISATDYILNISGTGVFESFSFVSASIKYDTTGGTHYLEPSTNYSSPESPWTQASGGTRKYSIYATYTASDSDVSASASSPSTLSDSITINKTPLDPNNASVASTTTATETVTITITPRLASTTSTSTTSDTATGKSGDAIASTTSTTTIGDAVTAERIGDEIVNLDAVTSSTSTAKDHLPPWYDDAILVTDTPTLQKTEIYPNNVIVASTSTLADAILSLTGTDLASAVSTSTLADAVLATTSGDNYALTSSETTLSDSITIEASTDLASVSSASTVTDQVIVSSTSDNYVITSSPSTVSDGVTTIGGGDKGQTASTSTLNDQVSVSLLSDNFTTLTSTSTVSDLVIAKAGAAQGSVSSTSTLNDTVSAVTSGDLVAVASTSTVSDVVTVSLDHFDINVADTTTVSDTATAVKAGAVNIFIEDGFSAFGAGGKKIIMVDGNLAMKVSSFYHISI